MANSKVPRNPVHGREATQADYDYLLAHGLPEHALMHDIKLYQVSKEGKNFGSWCWIWGDAFLGFHGQMPRVLEDPNSLKSRFNKGRLIPFPKLDDDEAKLGFKRIDVPAILKGIRMRQALADNTPDATPYKPPLKRAGAGYEINAVAGPPDMEED